MRGRTSRLHRTRQERLWRMPHVLGAGSVSLDVSHQSPHMKASTQFDYARLSQRLWSCVGVAIVATLASFGLSLLTAKLHLHFTSA